MQLRNHRRVPVTIAVRFIEDIEARELIPVAAHVFNTIKRA